MLTWPLGPVEAADDDDELLFPLPPQPAATEAAANTSAANAAIPRRFTCHLQRSRQDHGPREMARPVGVEPPGLCQCDGGSLDAHELGHRVRSVLHDTCPRLADVREESRLATAEHPDERALAGHADRAVAVLHGRVGLGPRPARLS